MNKINFKSATARLATVAAGALAFASTAKAEINTAGVTSALTEAGAAVAVVGAAMLIVYVGVKAFKLVRAAL